MTVFIFLGSKSTADGDCTHEIKSCLLFGRKVMTNLDSIIKSRDIKDKGLYRQSYGFSSSHVGMWAGPQRRTTKNWCFWIVVWEKIPENPFYCREIKPANLTGNQPWIIIGRTEAEAPILWLLHVKSKLTGKDTDARKRLKAKGEGCGRGWDG